MTKEEQDILKKANWNEEKKTFYHQGTKYKIYTDSYTWEIYKRLNKDASSLETSGKGILPSSEVAINFLKGLENERK